MLVVYVGWGNNNSLVGRILSVRRYSVHVGVSTIERHVHQSKARICGPVGGVELVLCFVFFCFFVAVGSMAREGIKGPMRPKAL